MIDATISVILVILLNIFKNPIIKLFTDNKEILTKASSVLIASIFLKPGRSFNTIIIPGLKGVGDVHFPVLVGIIFMWGIDVFGAYLLDLYFNLGLICIWIAMATD